jgi:hypothetical protein
MNSKTLLLFLGFSFALQLSAQESQSYLRIDTTGMKNPWTHLNFNNDPDNFQFAIVADNTGGHRPGIFEDAVRKLNLLHPEFVMSVGDLIEGYTRDTAIIHREWKEFEGFVSRLHMPFFYVPGNHDYINEVMARIWKDKFGPSWYHFVYRDVLFLCLNSEEAMKGSGLGGIEKPQFEYFKKVLSDNKDVRWTLLFMHQPLWVFDNTRYWNELEKLLASRKHTVFAGHLHHYVKDERNNGKYIMLATTGGVSSLRGPDYGEFDHLTWITMTDNGPVIANLLLNGIWDENMVTSSIDNLVKSDPLKLSPLFIENEIFTGGELKYELANPGEVSMNYSIRVAYPSEVEPGIDMLRGEVLPGKTIAGSIRLNAPAPVYYASMDPLVFSAAFSWEVSEERTVTSEKSYRLAPVAMQSIMPSGTRVQVDGKPDEWNNLTYSAGAGNYLSGDRTGYNGSRDASFRFDVSYDQNLLYLAVMVQDDEIVLNPDNSQWQQDGIRIYLDARTANLSSFNREENLFKEYLGIFLTPDKSNVRKPIAYQSDQYPQGTRVAASSGERYHFYEVGVPVSWLNAAAGGSWKNLRLNIAALDADKDGKVARVWWQPEWRSESNAIGSGMFQR